MLRNSGFILIFCFLFSCNPSRQLVSQGDALEQQGRHEEAADFYYNALLKKPGNSQAKEGLKKSAQAVLHDKFVQFSKQVLDNKIEDAVKQYKNAEKYADAAKGVGVILEWPSEYNEVYLDVRDEYVLGLYDNALRLLRDKKFDAAEQQFQQIAIYDSAYKDATILRLNTVLEPLYQRGIRQLAKGQFKDAKISFDRILEIDDHYRDTEKQRNLAQEKATVSLAIFPPVNKTADSADVGMLATILEKKLAKNSSAYIRIANSEEFHRNLEARGWSNISDPSKAADAGRNFGYKYVLLIQLTTNEGQAVPFNKVVREAYEAFTESILNPITNTYNYISKFRKTHYDDTYESRSLKYKVNYQLILSSSGYIILNDEVEAEKSDEQHLFSYPGNINNLYPELPNGNYLPPPNEAWKNQFTQVKRKLLSREELEKELTLEIAEKISPVVFQKLK